MKKRHRCPECRRKLRSRGYCSELCKQAHPVSRELCRVKFFFDPEPGQKMRILFPPPHAVSATPKRSPK